MTDDSNNKDYVEVKNLSVPKGGDSIEYTGTQMTMNVRGEENESMGEILIQKSISATKQEFPSVFRQAQRGFEIVTGNFKSKNEDTVSILATKDLLYILDKGFKYNPVVEKDENGLGYTIALDEIMVFGDGKTLDEAIQDLIQNVIDYRNLYFEKLDFYRQIPNRRGHFPYLRRLASCTNIKEVQEVIFEKWDFNSTQVTSKKLQNG